MDEWGGAQRTDVAWWRVNLCVAFMEVGSRTQWFLNAARGCPSSLGDFEMQPGLRFPARPTSCFSRPFFLLMQLLDMACVFPRDNTSSNKLHLTTLSRGLPGGRHWPGLFFLPSHSQFSISTVRTLYLDVSPSLHVRHAPHRAHLLCNICPFLSTVALFSSSHASWKPWCYHWFLSDLSLLTRTAVGAVWIRALVGRILQQIGWSMTAGVWARKSDVGSQTHFSSS